MKSKLYIFFKEVDEGKVGYRICAASLKYANTDEFRK